MPAPFAKDAAFESIDHLDLVIIITEHIPIHDTMEIMAYAKAKGVTVIGPNTPGVISPKVGKLGIMPTHIFSEGDVGVISRSGTLTYEIASQLTRAGIGQSTCVGIGGDPVIGTPYIEVLDMFENDPETKEIVLIGEIGGGAEEAAAEYIKDNITKPVVAYIAGLSAPPGKRMGLRFQHFFFNPLIIQVIVRHMVLYFIFQIWGFVKIKACSSNMHLFCFP